MPGLFLEEWYQGYVTHTCELCRNTLVWQNHGRQHHPGPPIIRYQTGNLGPCFLHHPVRTLLPIAIPTSPFSSVSSSKLYHAPTTYSAPSRL